MELHYPWVDGQTINASGEMSRMVDVGRHGLLVLVVGPSGAGKDTMIAGARARLAGDTEFVFPRRDITRAPDLGGEDYRAIGRAAFGRRRAAGTYSLDWQANELDYGIPKAIERDLAAGRVVVINVSRTVIERAQALYPGRVRIVLVTAPEAVLARRLRRRGREDSADIADRLARAGAYPVAGDDVATVSTDRPVDRSIAGFVAALAHFQAANR